MSESLYVGSTTARLVEGVSAEQVAEIAAQCFGDYTVDVLVDAAPDGRGLVMDVVMETCDGYSDTLMGHVEEFGRKAGPLLAEAMQIHIRMDTMMDERDRNCVIGPSAESVARFKRACAIERAIEALGGDAPELAELLKEARECEGLPPVRLVVDVEDGRVNQYLATAPVTIITFDDDVNGLDRSMVVPIFGQQTTVTIAAAEVSAEEVDRYLGEYDNGKQAPVFAERPAC